MRGGNVTACCVRPEGLQEWIGRCLMTLSCLQRSQNSSRRTTGLNSYPVFMQPITQLLQERMSQARAALGIPEEEAVEAGVLPVTDSLAAE